MVFCGQCGLQLAPGNKVCPRCGTAVESDVPVGDFHTDDPTVASPAYQVRNPSQPGLPPAGPSTPPNPKLVLRPDNQSYDYSTQAAYDPTSRMDASNVANRTPGYGTVSGGNYPPQAYADYQQSGGAYPPMGASYPGFPQQGGTGYQQPFSGQHAPAQPSSSRGRSVGLVLILIGLLFLLAAVVLFALQSNRVFGSRNDTSTPTTVTTPTTPTATQQAQALIQEYYNDVNARKYQAAYNLWKDNQQTFQDFRNGYKNTLHDKITFGDPVVQPDGTVKVTVTVVATQQTSSSTQQTTYQGYYLVEKQNDNSWKIIGGNLAQV